jgi:hypothetical protein
MRTVPPPGIVFRGAAQVEQATIFYDGTVLVHIATETNNACGKSVWVYCTTQLVKTTVIWTSQNRYMLKNLERRFSFSNFAGAVSFGSGYKLLFQARISVQWPPKIAIHLEKPGLPRSFCISDTSIFSRQKRIEGVQAFAAWTERFT